MTRALFCIFIILLLTNCNNQPVAVESKTNNDSIPTTYSKLHALFKDIGADTFYVYSDWSVDKKNFSFKGQAMDSIQALLLPYDIKNNYALTKDFAACYKFPLDEKNMALIARIGGEYVSSALKLFVFDLQKDSIIKTLNLADNVAEGGDASVYNSCIFKDKEKRLLILTYTRSTHDHMFGNITNENDTIMESWNEYYLFRLTNNKLDTLLKDSAKIVKDYSGIMRKLEGY